MEKVLKATHVGELKIGDLALPCAVLEDGTRVLSQRGFYKSLGGSTPGKRRSDDGKLPVFLGAANLQAFISKWLATTLMPVPYMTPGPGRARGGGNIAHGIAANLIPKICDVWLKARDAGVLHHSQIPIAKKADLLVRGLAEVGIVALIDEATGYQYDRAGRALAEILEAFIAKELAAWAKTFPDEFYREMFRLRGIRPASVTVRRPSYVGHLTNDVVYKRLAPGVLDALRRKNPPDETGHRRAHHHQWLTRQIGHPLLREHLAKVIALMQISKTWDRFIQLLDRVAPQHDDTKALSPGRT